MDKSEIGDLLSEKLDSELFTRVFPRNKEPQEHLKHLIKSETDNFNERIMNMVKLWDQKISNLRNELNISSIYRKLSTFSRKEEVEEKLQEIRDLNEETNGNILQLKIMIGKVGQMNDNVQTQIDTIYNRQKEVNIGIRNVNCLSCAIEPKKGHSHGSDGRLYRGLLLK